MREKYTTPHYRGNAFNCPWCGVYAHQTWHDLYSAGFYYTVVRPLVYSKCQSCKQYCLWAGPMLVYPLARHGPEPADDMPDDVKAYYEEARSVAPSSPRSAAALSRVALRKLMPHVGGTGRDLNEDVAQLVQQGLPADLQKALDTLRVIGDNAVQPGELDPQDDIGTATSLLEIVNLVVERIITHPKKIRELASRLPQTPPH